MSKINADQLTQLTVDVPELRFPGARSQASFWESAAHNLENGYAIGGGGVKEAVAFVLKQIGRELKLQEAGFVKIEDIDPDGPFGHLRDDAPNQTCDTCGRFEWTKSEWDTVCDFPQPDGTLCDGKFKPTGPWT